MADQKKDVSYLAPMAVGGLLLLYALGMFLLSDGDANPALLLLFAVLGLAALGWGFYRREQLR